MNWKPGDICIYDYPASVGGAHGMIVQIVEGPLDVCTKSQGAFIGYRFDPGFPHPFANNFANRPECFKPIPPEQTAGSWENCAFKPKELVVVSE